MVESRMSLAPHFAKAVRREEPEIVGKHDADAEGEGAGAGRAGGALDLREEPAGDAVAAEIGMHREAAEVQVLALTDCEQATHERDAGLGNDDRVISEGGSDGLGGLL
jgi:hypothetical protein